MKKLLKSKPIIATGALETGTIFYKIDFSDLLKSIDDDSNKFLAYLVEQEGFNAFDFEHGLYGSKVIDNMLYLCVTDGHAIEVDGNEIDPEDALDDYSVKALSQYIQDADTKTVKKYLSQYELKPFDVNEVAGHLITMGNSFTDLVKDADDLGVINY